MKNIALFGSTGSIGTSSLKVIDNYNKFNLKILVFGKNIELAKKQVENFKPEYIGCIDKKNADFLMENYDFIKKTFYGEGIYDLAKDIKSDVFISAISGSDGLISSLNALNSTKRIALANKETMVMAGSLFNQTAKNNNVEVIPVDSEHNAIFQCIKGEKKNSIKKILLTGSGGPFRELSKRKFDKITPKMALNHPNWSMGKKITIDSATLVNKGLELIEAVHLFKIKESKVEIVIHPQSIIHSMVKFIDNSIKAELSTPDMKLPIQYALNYPERKSEVIKDINLYEIGSLNFERVDNERFPSVDMAREAISKGGYLPLIYNRVNEESVYAFLDKKIKFNDIFVNIKNYLKKYNNLSKETVTKKGILEIDKKIKEEINKEIER